VVEPIQTERLILRPVTLHDASNLAERRSDPGTAEYQAWPAPYSIEKALSRDFAVRMSDNGKIAMIGYTPNPWACGRRYAIEAASALCTYLVQQTGVHRLEADTHLDNVASLRILERLGFAAEGIRRESYWIGDVVIDDAMFEMLAREWVWPRA
jgi:RimJ/RimL family protein N-acetyltransferase